MAHTVQKQIDGILQKEMSRQEFLTLIGAGILSMVGISSLVQMMSHKTKQQPQPLGYGMSPYGGTKD